MAKDLTFNNIDIESAVKQLAEQRDKILNEFAKAYLAETSLLPSQVELVSQQMPMTEDKIIETVYFFRKKNE